MKIDKLVSKTEYHQLIRYFCVGLLNLAFGYGIYLWLLELNFSPPMASITSGVLGVCFNFFTNGKLVFRQLPLRRIPHFFISYGITIAANALLLNIMVNAGLGPRLAQAILIPPMVAANYILQKYWVFAVRDNESKGK